MRILGIDPGLRVTGFGLIIAAKGNIKLIRAGVIRTTEESALAPRLHMLHQQVSQLIQQEKPEVAILEELYSHWRHPTTACLLGHARGVICLAIRQAGVRLCEYSSTKIKKSITGYGNASKLQIQKMVSHLLGEDCLKGPLDLSDALALAIAHAHIINI
jgi:crossover junction endodeoxyribonuclease RuvC